MLCWPGHRRVSQSIWAPVENSQTQVSRIYGSLGWMVSKYIQQLWSVQIRIRWIQICAFTKIQLEVKFRHCIMYTSKHTHTQRHRHTDGDNAHMQRSSKIERDAHVLHHSNISCPLVVSDFFLECAAGFLRCERAVPRHHGDILRSHLWDCAWSTLDDDMAAW